MEGGRAIARTLFGAVNPGGKLPFTIPDTEADLPPFDRNAASIHYEYFHGYTLLDRAGRRAAYPFGFGLSYTRFRVSAVNGVGDPHGVVSFTYKRAGNGTVEGRFSRMYDGGPGWDRYAFRGLPAGKYVVRVRFNSKPANSAYENCKTRFRQTVRPRA